MTAAAAATDFSVALLSELVRLGVRHLVLAPGSRSQALALVAAGLETDGHVRLHVRIDERSAAFTALGLAVETGLPAAVITTSGGAVANLHPAVLEAYHSGVPMILLTADRPPELRGIGSNQTTHQHGMFGAAVHFTRDIDVPAAGSPQGSVIRELARAAFSAAVGHSGKPGPVQLNLAFREPLSGTLPALDVLQDAGEPDDTAAAIAGHRAGHPGRNPVTLTAAPHTVVIAGHNAGEQAERVARELGAPLLAELTSGARFGPNLVVAYRRLLNDPDFGGLIRRAIVFGHPTLSREVPALLQRDAVEVIVVRGSMAEGYNPGRRATLIADAVVVDDVQADGAPPADRSWVGRWVHTSRQLVDAVDDTPVIDAPDAVDGSVTPAFQRQTLAALRAPITRRSLALAVWRASWPHDRVVFGASRLIRDADKAVPGKKIRAHANRGLAGIDGTIATATGIALATHDASDRAGITRVLLGDLALLHDAGSLLLGAGETLPPIQLIVGNDGGGTIFDGLEVAQSADPRAFDRVLYTPHAVDLASLAAAYGWGYRKATTRSELDEALTTAGTATVIEVPLPRSE